LLDESPARIKTLVAPAGYGKTTLSEQWLGRDGRLGAWFTARRSSTDVAALALGIARASTKLVPECDVRLREHLRAAPAPGEHTDVLAEILGEDFADWPSVGWLVLDEYQEISRSPAAERFVAELVAASPVQLLIASRERPSWVTARGILYGEFLELNQTALAMDSAEAAEVLTGRSAPSASGLVALANGWPAVIGLASVSSAEIEGEDQVPESLYRFFAEEVYGALGDDVQAGLATLVIAPVLDHELAGDLLGAEAAESVCAAALDVGILVEREARLDLHPLARAFLEERSEHRRSGSGRDVVMQCLARYKARNDWDAAFDLIARRGPADELEPLLLEALDDLLEAARLPTIEAWCALATDLGLETPAFSLARAEVALRQGRLAESQALAESAAATDPGSGLTFRALSAAGRAAHLASREKEGLELFRRAEAAASTEANRRDALWGRLVCEIELVRPEAAETFRQLTASVHLAEPREVVRAAAHTLNYHLKSGSVNLADADTAHELLPVVADPLVESSVQSVYSNSLALATRYEEALAVATALLANAQKYRLDFAVPYALCSAAMAHSGLREWRWAEQRLNEAVAAAHAGRNAHAQEGCFSVRIRALAQQGRHQAALALEVPSLRDSVLASRTEVLGSRALVLASTGRVAEAMEIADEVRGSTQAVESAVLIAAVDAIAALKRRADNALDHVGKLVETAFSAGALDLLVAAYRSTPELLAVLLRAEAIREHAIRLIRRVGDEDLARAIGQSIRPGDDPRERLSRREREVYDLLRQGLTNRQIAELLFISESTVKLHAHHVYDKVGVRSRTALAVQAALERADQATSATASPDGEDVS
jgi:ATP/maltotriose-dependent transcriptional regulator MalT